MPRYVAFLRAINVGGHTVEMAALKELFARMGFSDVSTFIASGNVIFSSRSDDVTGLRKKIEGTLHEALAYEVITMLRTDAQVAEIARYQSFPPAEMAAAKALNIAFLERPIEAAGAKALDALTSEIDRFHVHGTEMYWLCRMKQSDSKFSNVRFEKTVGVRATFRGANTLARLAALLG